MARGKKQQTSILSYVTVTVVTVVLVCALMIWGGTLKAKNDEYKERESQLYAQIEDESSIYDELNEQYEYMKTDDHVKDMAEAYFGLVEDGDVLLKPNK